MSRVNLLVLSVLPIVFLSLAGLMAYGADAEGFRMWTDATGKYTTKAKLLNVELVVRLEQESGTILTLPITKLSPSDQEYVKQRTARPATGEFHDAKSKNAEQEIAPETATEDAWMTDVLAFRKEIAVALDRLSGSASDASRRSAVDHFIGKPVRWTITFNGLGKGNTIEFAESLPARGKGSFLGSTIQFVNLFLQPDPTSLSQWRTYSKGQTVICDASVSSIMVTSRHDARGGFVGWMPIVVLQDARPVE